MHSEANDEDKDKVHDQTKNQATSRMIGEPQIPTSTALQESNTDMDIERSERPFGAASSQEALEQPQIVAPEQQA